MAALLEVLRSLPFEDVAISLARTLVFLGVVVGVAALFEWRGKADITRYRSRAFLHDLAYALFYRGGFYRVLVFSSVATFLDARLDFLRFGVLTEAPLALRMAVFWVAGDFVLYWIHRLQHAVPALWAFHAVHHSQENLSTLTQYRRHPVDQLLLEVGMYTIFPLSLGIPPETWLPLYTVMAALQALQHAELDWRFGKLYPLVVSPLFHAYHHSVDPKEHHGNYGFMFSVWDYLFGTAVRGRKRPPRFGVEGLELPTLVDQLVKPFLNMRGRRDDGVETARGSTEHQSNVTPK